MTPLPGTAYTRGRLIAHAGGAIDGRKYTNSAEAFDRSAGLVDLIEHDICDTADGLIVAHDGLEHAYGIKRAFSEITTENFAGRRFAGGLSVMTVDDLLNRLQTAPTSVVLDIKTARDEDYAAALSRIARLCARLDVAGRVIVQVYSVADFDAAARMGFANVILALWKNFSNVWTRECRECIETCFSRDHAGFRALSLAARHVWRDGDYMGDRLAGYVFGQSPMVFLHGQPEEAERPLLARGFGLFTHNPGPLAEALQDHPPPGG